MSANVAVTLSAEDEAKKTELQAQYGDDCAFYAPPGLGLVAVAPPDDPRHYWTLFRALRARGSDKANALAAFAVECVAYPGRDKAVAFLRQKPAFAIAIANRVKVLCGDEEQQGPALAAEEQGEVEELRKKHGEVTYYRPAGLGLLVLAAPSTPASYRQFFNEISDGADQTGPRETFEQFALDCVVHPARERVQAFFRRKPALAVKAAMAGQALCGGAVQELGKD